MRKSDLEEGSRWLRQAQEDLRWAKLLLREGGWHLACFLSQQITEKALKGFLYAQGEEIVLGPSVERLCASASRYREVFREKARTWSLLDGYYVPTRYPNGLPDGIPSDVFTEAAATDAVAMAEDAVSEMKSILEGSPS